jgi:hypothetical protein
VIIDLGDATLDIALHVKGLRRLRMRLHAGTPRGTAPEDRVVKGPPYATTPIKVDFVMDLMADQQVPLSVEYTDEVNNPVPAPPDATVVFTVDDPTIINLTDNGNGTATAAAVGTLGTANVHVVATLGDGSSLSGDLQIVVVAGLAERINVVAGPPTEVTPDV